MTARTDIHSVSHIVPANYDYVFSYCLPTSAGGWPMPSLGVNCELDRRVVDAHGNIIKNGEHDADGHCCVVGLIHIAKVKFADHGTTGKCSVCGAAYIYGDIWQHRPTGEFIHIGHQCADKYEMVADRTDFESANEILRSGIAAKMLKAEKEQAIAEFLTAHPGLEAALKVAHPIIQDIASKLPTKLGLSDAQVALVMKLANEKEILVPAPTGKTVFTGTVVSIKSHFSEAFGTTMKVTIKVTTPAGTWLAWGTCPKALLDEDRKAPIKGKKVEVTATLSPGNDAHFAKMSRPTGKLIP